MSEENTIFSVYDYIEIALRRKWLIILPILLIIPAGILTGYFLPKSYKAETTILVIPQNVPDSFFIKSTVTMNPSEYLNVLSQEILSRTHLEKVIRETYPELTHNINLENLVAQMRSNTSIDVRHKRNRSVASFTISYSGKDPDLIAKATNLMASLFIEENLRSRENQARKTTDFLSNELDKLKVTLESQEETVSSFKQRYLGSLPDQRDANLRMLDQLIVQRQRVADELNDTENLKILLQQQLIQSSDSFNALSANELDALSPATANQSRINALKSRLAELQNKYTDQHPDVMVAKIELQKLLNPSNDTKVDSQNDPLSPVGNEINQQLLALNLKIKTLKGEDALIKAKIADYQSRVEMAPKLEQQLYSINRDYENTQKAYDDLIKKRMEAEQAEKLEINQQGEQFKVLDYAKVPTKPFKPNRTKILFMSIMFSLALGGGLVFLAEFLDQSLYTVKDLENCLDLPVLVSIPITSEETLKNYLTNL